MPTFLHHHLHHGHPDEFTQVLRSRNLLAFGNSMASTFVALYLITIYGGLREALWPITVFLLSAYLLRALLMPLLALPVVRWGAKHTMAASYVFSVAALVMVAFVQANLWWILGFGLLIAIANGLFFTAYHVDLALTLNRGAAVKRGVGTVEMVRKVALALGPLIGGIIATRVSEQALFLVAAAVVSSAAAALYLRDDDVVSHGSTLKPLTSRRFYSRYGKDFVANFAMGINMGAATFLWSILLFLVIGSYEGVGLVVAVSLVLSLLVISFTRRHESLDSDRKEILSGTGATAAIHAVRPFVDTAAMAAGISFFNDLAYSLLFVPYIDRIYKHTSRDDGLSYITMMEIQICLGRTIIWLLFVGLYLLYGQFSGFLLTFIAASLGVLFISMIGRKSQLSEVKA